MDPLLDSVGHRRITRPSIRVVVVIKRSETLLPIGAGITKGNDIHQQIVSQPPVRRLGAAGETA